MTLGSNIFEINTAHIDETAPTRVSLKMSEQPQNEMKLILSHMVSGAPLSSEDAQQAFGCILAGQASDGQIGAFLMALRMRGETIDEMTAGARMLREQVAVVPTHCDVIDTCGTGGDGSSSYNISTAAAFVVAACGVPVAKHGNRGLSSNSGSSQVLEALGVALDLTPDQIAHCIDTTGMGFMFAPYHHSAMRHVGGVRQEMGLRTIFNLLGPLANPARATKQLIGVYDGQWLEPMAETLRNLGSQRAWIVHGDDGMDELTTTAPSHIAELKDGEIRTFTLDAKEFGIARATAADLAGGSPEENASALAHLLANETTPRGIAAYRDIVVLNSAAALVIADAARDISDGIAKADAAITSGAAAGVLEQLVALTKELSQQVE